MAGPSSFGYFAGHVPTTTWAGARLSMQSQTTEASLSFTSVTSLMTPHRLLPESVP
jgi:hypothetical protein